MTRPSESCLLKQKNEPVQNSMGAGFEDEIDFFFK